jgi:hypothetical protein
VVASQHGEDRAAERQAKAGHERFPFVGGSEDEGPGAEFIQGIAGEGLSQNENIVLAIDPAVIFCA